MEAISVLYMTQLQAIPETSTLLGRGRLRASIPPWLCWGSGHATWITLEQKPFDISRRSHPVIFFNSFTLYLWYWVSVIFFCFWDKKSRFSDTIQLILFHELQSRVKRFDVTLRYVTSYHVTLRHVSSYHVTLRHVTSCHVTLRHVTSCYVISRHVASCYVISRHVISCYVYKN